VPEFLDRSGADIARVLRSESSSHTAREQAR